MKTTMPGSRRKNHFITTPDRTFRGKETIGQNLPSVTGLPKGPRGRSLINYGPAVAGMQYKTAQASGPNALPDDMFMGNQRTLSEKYLYWALLKLLGPEWEGRWEYQGHSAANSQVRGFARVDFIIFGSRYDIGVRVQTYRFHMNVDPRKQAYDEEQLLALTGRYFTVIDVFEQDYIHDDTGQAAIQVMLEVINNRQRQNPLATGNVIGLG